MQSVFSLTLVALFSFGAYGQKGVAPLPQIIKVSKEQPTTPPRAVDESDRRKECPAGFNFIGKQCGKTLIEQPNIVCPKGTVLIDGRCASYVEKQSECPPGYIDYNGICKKTLTTPQEIICPEGYILRGKDICVTTVPLPEKKLCPPGSISKGDGCAITKPENPEYVCPAGYKLVGKRCIREETFDCTPPRIIQEIEEPSKKEHIRHPNFSKGKESNVYRLPAAQPIVEEYVIRKTCKRIITEAARPVCPKGGNFNGKLCLIDVLVAPVTKAGGFKEETLPPYNICPEGFDLVNNECVAVEEILPSHFCPLGTIDIGDRCATYINPKTICPEGFFLDGKICTKTIFAAPLVEYTVTYACTGKDCGNNHHQQH